MVEMIDSHGARQNVVSEFDGSFLEEEADRLLLEAKRSHEEHKVNRSATVYHRGRYKDRQTRPHQTTPQIAWGTGVPAKRV